MCTAFLVFTQAGKFHISLCFSISGVLHKKQGSGNYCAKVDQAWKRCSYRARAEMWRKLGDGKDISKSDKVCPGQSGSVGWNIIPYAKRLQT